MNFLDVKNILFDVKNILDVQTCWDIQKIWTSQKSLDVQSKFVMSNIVWASQKIFQTSTNFLDVQKQFVMSKNVLFIAEGKAGAIKVKRRLEGKKWSAQEMAGADEADLAKIQLPSQADPETILKKVFFIP